MSIPHEESKPVEQPAIPPRTPLIPLPSWADRTLRHQQCAKCKRPFGRRDVTAISLRRYERARSAIFCYEVECPDCNQPLLIYLPQRTLDVIRFAEIVLDAVESMCAEDRAIDAAAERSWDQRESRETLSRLHSHEEFMRFIGLSRADIRKYGTYRGRRKRPPQPERRADDDASEKK